MSTRFWCRLHGALCYSGFGGWGLVMLWERTSALFGALRFIWNATRGHRLTPWRSEFLRWRVETYSGKPAETLRTRDVLGFVWDSRWELLSFLAWTGRLERETRRRA